MGPHPIDASPTKLTLPREYGIAPYYRRCCWYAIVGLGVCAIVFCCVAVFDPNLGPVDVAGGCGGFALIAAGAAVPLRWRLRLDEDGIARRLIRRWDRWAWADLATGRVLKRHPHTLCDPQRPWWRRTLRLDYMAPADTQEVVSAINAHYTLPPPPDVPEAVTIKYNLRRSVTFDADGIHLRPGRRVREYTWRELRGIHIVRMDALRRDFTSLLIELPDEEIELTLITHQGGTSPTWRGATAEEFNEFLFHSPAADRIHVTIGGNPLSKPTHIRFELEKAEKSRRDLLIMVAIFTPLMIGLFVWMAIEDGPLLAILMSTMTFLVFGPVFWHLWRRQTTAIEDLRDMLNAAGDLSGREVERIPSQPTGP